MNWPKTPKETSVVELDLTFEACDPLSCAGATNEHDIVAMTAAAVTHWKRKPVRYEMRLERERTKETLLIDR